MRSRLFVLMAATAIAVFSFACGGDDDDNTIETDGGEVTTSDDLPDDWPDSFPIYDGADLLGTATGESEGISGTVATWETEDSVDDVKEFYDNELADDPWSTDSSSTVSGDSAFWLASNADDDSQAYVLVSGDGDATTIVATVGDLGAELQTPIAGSDDDEGAGSDDGSDDGADDGSGATLPEQEELPDDFPEDRLAIPDDAHIFDFSSTSTQGVNASIVSFYSEDEIGDLADSLDGDLQDEGWTQTIRTASEGDEYLSYSDGDNPSETLVVTITDGDVEGYARVDMALTVLTAQ